MQYPPGAVWHRTNMAIYGCMTPIMGGLDAKTLQSRRRRRQRRPTASSAMRSNSAISGKHGVEGLSNYVNSPDTVVDCAVGHPFRVHCSVWEPPSTCHRTRTNQGNYPWLLTTKGGQYPFTPTFNLLVTVLGAPDTRICLPAAVPGPVSAHFWQGPRGFWAVKWPFRALLGSNSGCSTRLGPPEGCREPDLQPRWPKKGV